MIALAYYGASMMLGYILGVQTRIYLKYLEINIFLCLTYILNNGFKSMYKNIQGAKTSFIYLF